MTTKGKITHRKGMSTQLNNNVSDSKIKFKSAKRVVPIKGSRRGSRRS